MVQYTNRPHCQLVRVGHWARARDWFRGRDWDRGREWVRSRRPRSRDWVWGRVRLGTWLMVGIRLVIRYLRVF